MIRFSAALVAVAIGVLIGGIATSKLLLVYIAVAASAVALLVLAIGVVLRREELFGEEQGFTPAAAGVGPVLPARAGDSYDRNGPNGHGTPPPGQGAAVGPGAAFAGQPRAAAGQSQAASQPGTSQSGTPAAAPQPTSPWDASATRSPWESSVPAAPPTVPAAPPPAAAVPPPPVPAGPPPAAAVPTPSAWQQAAPVQASGWGAPEAATAKVAAEPGPPTWFTPSDKPGESASTDVPAAEPAPDGTDAVDSGARDGGDNWPTRHSWLDDEPEEPPKADDNADDSGNGRRAGMLAAVSDVGKAAPAASEVSSGGDADRHAPAAVLRLVRDRGEEPETPEASVLTSSAAEPGPEQSVTAQSSAEPPATQPPAVEVPASDEATDEAGQAGLVAVVRGVRRYHQPDCVLARFMPEADRKLLSLEQAKEVGCTPCGACRPEGYEA